MSDELLHSLFSTMTPAPSQVLRERLFEPVRDFQARPSKKYRSALVVLGARLVAREAGDVESDPRLLALSNIVELLHSASLILDDIQDGGTTRRGGPAQPAGASIAESLNLAGWLSWYPMCLVSTCGFPAVEEVSILRALNASVAKAYAGQTLDVSTDIRTVAQADAYDAYLSTATLKTGSVTAVSLAVGAIAAGGGPDLVGEIATIGERLGVVLQIFDDIGNFRGAREPAKRFEDMFNRCPSWIWASASRRLGTRDYAAALAAIDALPDTGPLELADRQFGLLEHAETSGRLYLGQLTSDLERFADARGLAPAARDEFARLTRAISRDYR
jgi:geranylgeranyl diphosphate synthase type I